MMLGASVDTYISADNTYVSADVIKWEAALA